MITFYYGSGSPFAWRVWLALEHKELPYDLKVMSFSSGDLKAPEYLRMNPRGKVPTIEDDGFSLYESAAIVEYLEDQYPQSGATLFPGDARSRAHLRRLVNEADLYLDAAGRKLVQAVLFTNKEDWDEARISAGRVAVAAELSTFEDYLSGDYYGDELSAADFTIYPLVALMRRMEVRKPDLDVASLIGPKMSAWIQRVESLPFYSRTYPPHWKAK
ncbi:MAG: glutathione S-transferase family protein [Betaproteobacteria bacterium]|nr:MAG: glutathione S-transferase family protein [Betaproteobacteria bacterium]